MMSGLNSCPRCNTIMSKTQPISDCMNCAGINQADALRERSASAPNGPYVRRRVTVIVFRRPSQQYTPGRMNAYGHGENKENKVNKANMENMDNKEVKSE